MVFDDVTAGYVIYIIVPHISSQSRVFGLFLVSAGDVLQCEHFISIHS
jgi:hypothetical protein